ncbi:hypothetical protein [Jatrophihabitans endophyticus]|uniref:hypothetical protein n=1 Tax=Jatrophihabitans endophyticus TaxID=1206085 RepID=UPI001A07229E|nr:hypothetical protein [Jatrophihabitans endophyticus]MBE7188236.1 ferric reductase [Jatrophihabitans endophyticus]
MTIWYLARAAGLSALVLFSVSTALGALVSRRGPATRRYVVQYVHRATAALGLVVLALHIGLLLADSYAGVGWVGAIVPFESGYRPGWVALGTIAGWVFVLAAVLGLARGRLASSPRAARVWRGVHALAYLGWGAAMWHGFESGTDSGLGWTRALYVVCLAGVLSATAWRVGGVLADRAAASGTRDRFAGRPAPATTARVTPEPPFVNGVLR